MKNNRHLIAILALTALLDWSIPAAARADTFTATFTNEFGDGIWERDQDIDHLTDPNDSVAPGNWSTGAYPSNGHTISDPNTGNPVPGPNPEYNVVIGASAGVTLGAQVNIRTLDLGASSTLNLAPAAQLGWIADSVVNNGTVVVNTSAGASGTGLRFNANPSINTAQLSGSGTIRLNGVNFNEAFINNGNPNTGGGGTLTHGASHRIHGRGDVITNDNAATFFNRGTIDADVSGGQLRLYFSNNANENTGTLRAMNGATLYVQGGILSQTSQNDPRIGSFLCETGSMMQMGDFNFANNFFRLKGGSVETVGTGLIDVSSFDVDDVTSNAAMRILPGRRMRVLAGGLTNNGTVLVNSTADPTDTMFIIEASSELDGTGSLQLNGIDSNDGWLRNDGSTFTHGADHLIHGRGDITASGFGSVFINHGTVAADMNGGELRVFFGNSLLNVNDGALRAENGGTLFLETGQLEQTGNGHILAANGSLVRLGNSSFANNVFLVSGGTVNTSGNGLLQAEVFGVNGVTNNGAIQVPNGRFIRMEAGGLTNNGTVVLNPTAGTTGDTTLHMNANSQLVGSGSLQLNGIESNDAWIRCDDFGLTHGASHRIHGRGDIQASGHNSVFINDGMIDADVAAGELRLFMNHRLENRQNGTLRATNGATLFLQTGRYDQTNGGRIVAAAGSTVLLGNPGFANNRIRIFGGTLEAEPGGVIQGLTTWLSGEITLAGAFEVPADRTTAIDAATLTNNGTFSVLGSNANLRFELNSSTIEGIGAIQLLNGAIMRIDQGIDVVNGNGHRIKGDGSIAAHNASITNNGTVAPGLTIGTLTVNGGAFLQGNTGILEIELGGTTAGSGYDQLVINGNTTLGGTLNVFLINGFFPLPGDVFTVVSTAGTRTGEFANVGSGERLNTMDLKGSFIVDYSGKNVVLSSFGPPVGNGPLNLRLTSPKVGGNNGGVTLALTGTGVVEGATVLLRQAGLPDILADAVNVGGGGTSLAARFNLTGQSLGNWDVVVTNPDGSTFVINGGFTIQAGTETRIWADLLHRKLIRSNSASRFTVVVGNHGNTDAYGVPIFVSGIPSAADVSLQFGLISVPRTPGMPEELDPNAIPPVIQTPEGKVIALVVPVIPAGTTVSYQFTIKTPNIGRFSLDVTALGPLLELVDSQTAMAGLKNGTHRRLYARDGQPTPFALSDATINCLNTIFQAAVGCLASIVPGAECPKAALAGLGFVDNLAQIIGNAPTTADGKALSLTQLAVGGISTILASGQCLAGFTPAGPILDILACALSGISVLWDCGAAFFSSETEVVGAVDPNDKVGAIGSGPSEHYLTGNEPFRYAIFFENQPSATAPAQEVAVTDQLDVSKFDLDTFQLGAISFGNGTVLTPPAGLSEWIADADLRPAKDLIVRVFAALDKNTGIVSWRFFSLDPATMLPTDDPLAGFLPPNQTAPEGDGAVTFTVETKPGLTTGTQVLNGARIVFDANAPIDTAQWLNTIDNSPPTSQVEVLPSSNTSSSIQLNWSGSDDGAGIKYYAIYVSENGGAFTLWRNSSESGGVYQGRPNASYSFYSVAVDGAGNFEIAPISADTSTTTLSGQLLNIATRLRVQTGENVLIGGVIVTGTDPKRVILRAIGPSLSQVFDGALADPVLELYQGDTLVASNDNWKDSQQGEIEGTTIPPTNDLESAIVQTLAPGFYTAVMSGKNDGTGIGVIEAYDLDQAANSKLANISSRGFVEAGDNVMIGGLIAGGNGGADTRVLLRAIGPSLAAGGVAGALQDPLLELRDANGNVVRENDNWQDSQQAEIEATTIPPSNGAESAIVVTLPPGNYTAIVRGKNDASGVGLVEVYNVQ